MTSPSQPESSQYTLHYTSEDLSGGTWSVYSEQYENEAADKAAGPIDGLTVLVSTHPSEQEADAEANRLQRPDEFATPEFPEEIA